MFSAVSISAASSHSTELLTFGLVVKWAVQLGWGGWTLMQSRWVVWCCVCRTQVYGEFVSARRRVWRGLKQTDDELSMSSTVHWWQVSNQSV